MDPFQQKYGLTYDEAIEKVQKRGNEKPHTYAPKSWTNMLWNPLPAMVGSGALTIGTFARGFGEEEAADQLTQSAVGMMTDTDQAVKNARQGIAGLPGAIPSTYGLATAGVSAGARYLMGDEQWQDSLFADGGQEKINQSIITAANLFKKARPDATEEQVQAFLAQYQDSPEYAKTVMENLAPGLSMGARIDQWAADLAGHDRRPDEQNSIDTMEQIIGGALVGLPASVSRNLASKLARTLPENVVRSKLARGGAKVAEAVTPLTLPLTPGNVAVNAGVGIAGDQAFRALTDQPTLVDELDSLVPPQDVPVAKEVLREDDGSDVSANLESSLLGLEGAIFGIFGLAVNPTRLSKPFINAGDTIAEQVANNPDIVKPGLGLDTGVKNVWDTQAPIVDALRAANQPKDVIDTLEAEIGLNVGIAGESAVNRAIAHGELPGLNYRTIPLAQLRQVIKQQGPDFENGFNEYVFAKQAMADRSLMMADASKELSQTYQSLLSARNNGNKQATTAAFNKFQEAQKVFDDLQNDVQTARPSLEGWDNARLSQIVADGMKNPEFVKLEQEVRKLTDALLDMRVKRGMMTLDQANELRARRPLYATLREDPYEATTGIERAKMIFAGRLKSALGMQKGPDVSYNPEASRNLETDVSIKVNNPVNLLDALQENINRSVRAANANYTRVRIIDELMSSSWKGKHIKQMESNGRFQFTDAEIAAARAGKGNGALANWANNPERYIAVRRQGMNEFYEFGDETLKNALMFNAPIAVPVLNATRKLFQQGTTGLLNPIFAGKAMTWETMSGSLTKREGRDFGLLQTAIRAIMRDQDFASKINASFADPTAILQSLASIPRQVFWRTYGAVGEKIMNDLATSSGLFAALQNTPAGKVFTRKLAANMIRAFDQSATGILLRNNIGASTMMLAESNAMRMDYDRIIRVGVPSALRVPVDMYKGLLDSVHLSAKEAFFQQNYAVLKTKYKGKALEQATRKLINETRTLSGDMARQGGSKAYQGITSVVPYSNVTVQSLRHVIGTMKTDPVKFTMRLTSGVLMPTLYGYYMMSNWDDEARDYWWNRIPEWQRISSIPVPTWDTYLAWARGEEVPFSEDAIQLIPMAPEFIPFNQAFVAGLRGIGLLDGMELVKGNQVPVSALEDLRAGMGSLINLALPPLLSAGLAMGGEAGSIGDAIGGRGFTRDIRNATFGGVNSDRINVDSDISRRTAEVVAALGGTAARVGVEMLDTYSVNRDEGATVTDALSKALGEGTFQYASRAADVPIIWNATEKLYKYTPVAEHVYEFTDTLAPLIGPHGQMVVERDRKKRQSMFDKAGLDVIPTIQEPLLKAMATETAGAFSKGAYKKYVEEESDLNALLTAIDGSKEVMAPEKRAEARKVVLREYGALKEKQARFIEDYEGQMRNKFGDQFQSLYGVEWSPESMVEVIRSNVR